MAISLSDERFYLEVTASILIGQGRCRLLFVFPVLTVTEGDSDSVSAGR